MGTTKYSKMGFDKDQLEQLRLGQENGVDISIYANPAYMALQMEWIRKGLEASLDVSVYASLEYDWFQMEEIYEGLKASLDVSKYCKSSVPYERMREIRKGLLKGVDLSPFVAYEADELRELRYALAAKANIAKYMVEGYDSEQLAVIRDAIVNGINIDPYLSKSIRGVALSEIVIGLKKKLKVDSYANDAYNWKQMREIREGLEGRLDTTLYDNCLYNADQMHEIRLGLEAGLDVSSYSSLMYTANDMRKKRLKLIEELTGGHSIPMVPGNDGYYEYFFDTDKNGDLVYHDDDKLDFDRSYSFSSCGENEIIAVYHPATEGKPGISKDGTVVRPIRGKEKTILTGRGMYYDENRNSYVSAGAGWIHLDEEKNLLEVVPAYSMDSVPTSLEHVTKSGNLEVMGNVESGTRINVDGDLIINGHVADAIINCSGNLVIRGGINGNAEANITAGKNIISRYIENCKVNASGDVYTDYILSSNVHANGSVEAVGVKGSIIRSHVAACKGIHCMQAGNEYGAATELSIIHPDSNNEYELILVSSMDKVGREIQLLTGAKEQFIKKLSEEQRNTNPDFIKIENAIYTKNIELREVMKNYNCLMEHKKEELKARITAFDNLYQGVVLAFGKLTLAPKTEKGSVSAVEINGKIKLVRE